MLSNWNILAEELVTGLSRVSWEKVDVSFHSSRQRFAAHSVIQVCLSRLFSHLMCGDPDPLQYYKASCRGDRDSVCMEPSHVDSI